MSPPWGLCLIFFVEPTWCKLTVKIHFEIKTLDGSKWNKPSSTLDSAFQSSFRFSILTSPPPARWVAWYPDYYHTTNFLWFKHFLAPSLYLCLNVFIYIYILQDSTFSRDPTFDSAFHLSRLCSIWVQSSIKHLLPTKSNRTHQKSSQATKH